MAAVADPVLIPSMPEGRAMNQSEVLARVSSLWFWSAVCLVVALPLLVGLAGMGNVSPLHVFDGTYQTFGMLDRFVAGDLPGVNQVPYLGVLLCYALGPLYVLFGATIYAAFAAAQVAVMVAWLGSIWLVAWALGRNGRDAGRLAVVLFVALASLYALFKLTPSLPGNLNLYNVVYEPGNSLVYLRDAASSILVALTCTIADAWRRRCALAFGAGVLLFWSPASGIATFLVALVVVVAGEFAARKDLGGFATRVMICLSLAMLAFLVASTVLSGGHPIVLIERVYIDTGGNQFWFFGPFGDGTRLLNLRDAPDLVSIQGRASIIVILILATFTIVAWLQSRPFSSRADALAILAGSMLLSGVISQAGGHLNGHYLLSFVVTTSLIPLIWLYNWVASSSLLNSPRGQVCVKAAGAFVLLALVSLGTMQAIKAARPAVRPTWVVEAGMAFPRIARGEVEYLRRIRIDMDRRAVPADQRIMSSYFAWPNVLLGAAPQPRFNSIIHLLTPADRALYADHLKTKRPQMVATMDWRYTAGWELWNVRASWAFYRVVLANYRPAASGTQFVYWTRRAASAAMTGSGLPICRAHQAGPDAVDLIFEGPVQGFQQGAAFLDVSIAYEAQPGRLGFNGDLGRGYVRVDDRSSALRTILARYYARAGSLVEDVKSDSGIWYGLPAGLQRVSLPVQHDGRSPSRLRLEMQGGAEARLRVTDCRTVSALPDPYIDPRLWPAVSPPYDSSGKRGLPADQDSGHPPQS